MLVQAGMIKNLRIQVPFALYPAKDGLTINKSGKPVMRYIADFVYDELARGKHSRIVEDFKGSEHHTTDVFKIKRRLIESAYQIQIRITT